MARYEIEYEYESRLNDPDNPGNSWVTVAILVLMAVAFWFFIYRGGS